MDRGIIQGESEHWRCVREYHLETESQNHVVREFNDLFRLSELAKDQLGFTPWYRGQANAAWSVVAPIHRHIQQMKRHPSVEQAFMFQFRAQARSRHAKCPDRDDSFGWLSLMRHFGLPTRILDWTTSLMVATTFAVDGEVEQSNDSAIYAIDPCKVNGLGRLVPSGIPLPPNDMDVKQLADGAYTLPSGY